MNIVSRSAWNTWYGIRTRNPLIHQITNMVVMNEQAHATLAIGASPVMSLHPSDAGDLAEIADASTINIGTPLTESTEAMHAMAQSAMSKGRFLLLDPVGYGAAMHFNRIADELLAKFRFNVIKGNAGEIGALGRAGGRVRGVDALDPGDTLAAVKTVAREHQCIAIATGLVDYVSDGERTWRISGGSDFLTRITGSGCWLGAVIAAACVVAENPVLGTITSLCAYGAASEKASINANGPGTFRVAFLDELANLHANDFERLDNNLEEIHE